MQRPTIGHPFFFPTQVVLVDDDQDFLDSVSLMLSGDLSHKLFTSAPQALAYINEAHKHVEILKRCYASYKTGPMASDALTHVDIAKLHIEALNPERFRTVSTLVVDYSMPDMNGLELLSSLKNPFVKKVLLTGRGDMEMAIRAFNSQLIDQFIDKQDPHLKSRLNAAIAAFQDQYFRNSFKLVTDQILANSHDAFLVNGAFQDWFAILRKTLGTIEYYLLDEPHNGFLLVDADGRCHMLVIHTDASLDEHLELIAGSSPPEDLVTALKNRECLPAWFDKASVLSPDSPFLKNWKQHYVKVTVVKSDPTWFVAAFPVEKTGFIDAADIRSFNSFQQQLVPVNEILH